MSKGFLNMNHPPIMQVGGSSSSRSPPLPTPTDSNVESEQQDEFVGPSPMPRFDYRTNTFNDDWVPEVDDESASSTMRVIGQTCCLFWWMLKLGSRKVPDQTVPRSASGDEVRSDPYDNTARLLLSCGVGLTVILGTFAGLTPLVVKLVHASCSDRDWSMMWCYVILFMFFTIALLMGRVCANYVLGKAVSFLRRNATRKLQQMYMDRRAIPFFVLNQLDTRLDNADDRIVVAVSTAFNDYLEFFCGSVKRMEPGMLFNVPCYTALSLTMWKMVWFENGQAKDVRKYYTHEEDPGLRPMALVLVITCLPVVAIFIAFYISLLVTKAQRTQYSLEAQLRRVHARIRLSAEAIAFYGGEQESASMLRQKLDDVIKNMKRYAFCKVRKKTNLKQIHSTSNYFCNNF